MHTKGIYAIVILACTSVLLPGCKGKQFQPAVQSAKVIVPPGIIGTIGQYADLVGGQPMPVTGYGVVVGLGDAGSLEVPTHLREYLIRQMGKYKIGSPNAGLRLLPPGRILRDKDTAVVVVSGQIPPAAPAGTLFDIYVKALPRTQTLSLAGGRLMSTEMHLYMSTPLSRRAKTKAWSVGNGDLFVNPFLDPSNVKDQARFREGRIPNGGKVTLSRPIRLELHRPDYRRSRLIQRRLNERFGGRVAVAKTPSIIELHIPRSRRRDYLHFLQLVMHVHLSGRAGGDERYARELAGAILLPEARYEDIALVWEAMGRQVLSILRKLYTSDNPAAAFYSTRTGLRLEDPMAVDPMIHIARQANSTFQIAAVGELGRARKFLTVLPTLKRMLSDSNALLRIAAYEALLKHGSRSVIRRQDISGRFVMDVVDTEGDYAIYVTLTGRPKIVLFGSNIPLNRPLFYCPKDELVTVNASRTDKRILIYRKVPTPDGSDKRSDIFYVAPRLDELVKIMGLRSTRDPEGNIRGLGLKYSQIVGVLHGLCNGGHISAKFVLQHRDAAGDIYSTVSVSGRPDMPEEK